MRIGLLLPANYAIASAGNGTRMMAWKQADALEKLGHEVLRLNPWEVQDAGTLDVVQFYMGGYAHQGIDIVPPRPPRGFVLSAVIDSNQPNWRYRLATAMGNLFPRIDTIPGVLRQQALLSRLVVCMNSPCRDRIIHGLGIDPNRIPVEVILNGTDPPGPPGSADPDEVRNRLALPPEFLLHVSAYTQGRKNVVRLMKAVGPTGLPLVIAGTPKPSSETAEIEALAKRYNMRVLGFLDPPTLRSLYAACKVFCLPSINEGTGLVALEAASYGAAVVITRNGGPIDYFQDLAEYVDPYSISDIRDAVLRAWNQPKSSRLKDHVLQNLTWEASARSLETAYRRHVLPPDHDEALASDRTNV